MSASTIVRAGAGLVPLVHHLRWVDRCGRVERFKETDFKIWPVLAYLSARPGRWVSARDLAARADVGVTSVFQFLRRLERAGLATAERSDGGKITGVTWTIQPAGPDREGGVS